MQKVTAVMKKRRWSGPCLWGVTSSLAFLLIFPIPSYSAELITDTAQVLGLLKSRYQAPAKEIQRAVKLNSQGRYQEARAIFSLHARQGDVRAMLTMGMSFYQGNGSEPDYFKAATWFSKAARYFDGDALNNLGVMFRDGKGVDINPQIAYGLFWVVHLRGLGGEATQYRAGNNIEKIVRRMSEKEIQEADRYTEVYILSYALTLGHLDEQQRRLIHDPRYHTIQFMKEHL